MKYYIKKQHIHNLKLDDISGSFQRVDGSSDYFIIMGKMNQNHLEEFSDLVLDNNFNVIKNRYGPIGQDIGIQYLGVGS